MNVYRVNCSGLILFVEANRPLNDADIQLFKSCAADARHASKTRNVNGILADTVSRFNSQALITLRVARQPWLETIAI